jgi:mannonate dehydratase
MEFAKMKITFPWYGEEDTITLDHISYLRGAHSLSSALYSVPDGELWVVNDIRVLKERIESAGLAFEVVENLPVHDDIKLRRGDCERYIDNYKENIARLSMAGAGCVCYDFSPPAGAADDDGLIRDYVELGSDGLWRNFELFVREIIPIALRRDINMAIRIGEPRFQGAEISRIPRLVDSEESVDRLLSIHGDHHHGIVMSSEGLNLPCFEDYLAMINKYGTMERIHYALLRDVKVKDDGTFEETVHCSPYDSRGMARILTAYHEVGFQRNARFDHSRMSDSVRLGRNCDLYDRAVGTMYLTGILSTLESRIKLVASEKIA